MLVDAYKARGSASLTFGTRNGTMKAKYEVEIVPKEENSGSDYTLK